MKSKDNKANISTDQLGVSDVLNLPSDENYTTEGSVSGKIADITDDQNMNPTTKPNFCIFSARRLKSFNKLSNRLTEAKAFNSIHNDLFLTNQI